MPFLYIWLQVQIFAVGDAGALTSRQVRLYQAHWKGHAKSQDLLIWLGDNIYPSGYIGDARSRRRWERLLAVSRAFPGQVYITPGNHDWKAGLKGLLQCEKDLRHDPPPGQMGPTWQLIPPYAFIFIDSELYIQTRGQGFCWERLDSLLGHLSDSLTPVVILHHPPLTVGAHGGYFPLGAHLFPLRTLSRYLYIPLPGLGTLLVLLRKAARHSTDQSYPAYGALADSLRQRALRSAQAFFVLSGHDHNLQLHRCGKGIFIVSGSGCKTEPLARRRAVWGRARVGYWVGSSGAWQAYALTKRPRPLYEYAPTP
jgi:hypothetical protein